MAIVFRFETYDITTDAMQRSNRWATKEAIERVRGRAISEGVEIDDRLLGVGGVDAVDGMTARGYDPLHPPRRDFGR